MKVSEAQLRVLRKLMQPTAQMERNLAANVALVRLRILGTPDCFSVATARALVKKRLVRPTVTSRGRITYVIADLGRQAVEESSHLEKKLEEAE